MFPSQAIRLIWFGLLVAGSGAVTLDGSVVPQTESKSETPRFFAATSTWNTRIAAAATADPNSPAMIDLLNSIGRSRGFLIAVKQWTWSVYEADRSTPRFNVWLRASWAPARLLVGVPIPANAVPDPAGDGHLAVIDRTSGCEYDFWQAVHSADGSWSAAWANALDTGGSGWFAQGLSARGSGAAGLGGLIRPEEIAAGRIDHALSFSFNYAKAGGPVAPATESDGTSTLPGAIPEGARLQLDPAMDLEALGLKPYELAIARALQTYGMVLVDVGGGVTLEAQNPLSTSTPYPWLDRPYIYLPTSLLSRMRVLATGQQMRPRLSLENTVCATFQ